MHEVHQVQPIFCQLYARVYLFLFALLLVLLAGSLGGKEVAEAVEVLFHDEADALGVERRSGEVAVVGLVVNLQGQVAIGVEEVLDVEVADE